MVIGLLAILKAGGAYVPIDAAYPRARQTFMLTDAAVSLLLTQIGLASHLDLADVSAIALDDENLFSGLSDKNLASAVNPNNVAYLIYTSGSTGQPKGVVASHGSAVNRIAWMWRRYPFRAGEVCCSKTSLSFVDSVWEIFGPLLQGVRLVIAPDRVAQDPRLLRDFLAVHAVSRIVLVPAVMKALLDECPNLAKQLPKLLDWTCSGEALPSKLAEQFKKSHPHARLLNLYGSSEVAADVTCFEYDGDVAGPSVPIGRPIDNTQVYLLDEHMQPVPLGVVGELYVGGAGVARGYWQRPELSTARFVANPFSEDRNSRLFRSGDLARYLVDGNIEFRGRADGQIKLRGQRIELAEIEMVLRQHGDILDCVVLPRYGGGSLNVNQLGSTSLMGYIVAKTRPGPSVGELRAFVKERLPEFMVPSAFLTLDCLPLLPNGKVDRQALAAFSTMPASESANLAPPRSEAEEQVAAIWRDMLHLKRVGIHENFFELGGHSLLGVQLVAALRRKFAKEIALHEFFETPTVAGVAAKLSSGLVNDNAESLPAIEPLSLSGKVPLSSSQELFWRLDDLLSGADFLNLPYGYRLTGPLDLTALRQSLQTIVDRHAILRTIFRDFHDRPVQLIRRALTVRLPLVNLGRLPDGERQAALRQISSDDANGMFDLAAGPPFRVKLIRLAAEEHVLLITLHHIVGDQWSMRLLRRELTQLYEAFAQGRPASLPSLPFQFVDFARWQRRILDTGRLASQFDYWKQKLAGPLPTLRFQSRRKQSKAVSLRTARKAFELAEAQFSKIQELARRQKTTPFVVLLAALDVWLWCQTGCRDLCVGTLVTNRSRPDTEKLIGYFVNAVVLRGRIDARMTFVGLLRQLHRVVLDAFEHQDVPIVELSRALLQNHPRARQSLYQVMINYQRYANLVDIAGGLTIASWTPGGGRAAVPEIALTSADLNFEFRETTTKLTASVNYRVDLFNGGFIERLANEFPTLLNKLTSRPDRRLSSVTI
jgi:amino acid adenylation domain-containing protein